MTPPITNHSYHSLRGIQRKLHEATKQLYNNRATESLEVLNTSSKIRDSQKISNTLNEYMRTLDADRTELFSVLAHLDTITKCLDIDSTLNGDQDQLKKQISDVIPAIKSNIANLTNQEGKVNLSDSIRKNYKLEDSSTKLNPLDLSALTKALEGKKDNEGIIYDHTEISEAVSALTKVVTNNLAIIDTKGTTSANIQELENAKVEVLQKDLETMTTLSHEQTVKKYQDQQQLHDQEILYLTLIQNDAAHKKVLNEIIRRIISG